MSRRRILRVVILRVGSDCQNISPHFTLVVLQLMFFTC